VSEQASIVAPDDGPKLHPVFVSPQEAANALGVSKSTLYRLLDDGVIASARTGGRRHVLVASLLAYADAAREQS
jgi:excisionase family DNA binding protein